MQRVSSTYLSECLVLSEYQLFISLAGIPPRSNMSFYLAIVSPLDAPLYELQFTSPKSSSSTSAGTSSSASSSFPSWSSFTSSTTSYGTANPAEDSSSTKLGGQLGLISNSGGPALERHLAQMVAFAALDSVDEVVETTGSLCVSPTPARLLV